MSSLVYRITEALEPPETVARVKNSFDSFRKNGSWQTMDLGMIMQTVIKNGVGIHAEGILKAIHQGVILSTAYEIKHKVTKLLMTKDVRSKVHCPPSAFL